MNRDFDCALHILNLDEKAIKRMEKNEKLSFSEIQSGIEEKYNYLYRSSCNFDELRSKLHSSKDNNCLFYTGIEQNINNKYINQIGKFEDTVKEKYNHLYFKCEGLIKTKIPHRKDKNKKRLISILFFLILESQTNVLNGKYLYVMIPISYENCHSG